jgi:hypothetical protein
MIRFPVTPGKPPKWRKAVFPLVESAPPAGALPVLIVVVGDVGRRILDQLQGSPPTPPTVVLSAGQPLAAWRQAVKSALRTAQRDGPSHGGRLGLVLVGEPEAIMAQWHELADRLQALCPVAECEVVSLEVVADPPWNSESFPAQHFLARFQFSLRYNHASLSPAEGTRLVACLLRQGLGPTLVRWALAHPSPAPVVMGAAAGWLPRVSVARALAAYLIAQLARSWRKGIPTHSTGPGRIIPNTSVRPWLQAQLRREAEEWQDRLTLDWRTSPVTGLEEDLHPGRAEALKGVDAWLSASCHKARQVLEQLLWEPSQLGIVQAGILRAFEEVQGRRRQAERRKQDLTQRRVWLARRVRDEDERRLRARQQGFIVWRWLRAWYFTRRTRKQLREYVNVRCEELLANYEELGLAKLQSELEDVRACLDQLPRTAGRGEVLLGKLLAAPGPNAVPLQEQQTLEAVLGALLETGNRARGRLLFLDFWKEVIRQVLRGSSPEGQWKEVRQVALTTAARIPDSAAALASRCRGLLPRLSPASMSTVLTRLARPGLPAHPGQKRVEMATSLPGAADELALPAVLWFYFQPITA